MQRSVLALLGAVIVCLHVSSKPSWAQTAPAKPLASGELVPFWLVIPEYPQIAQAARVQGVVTVMLAVGADGRVESTTIDRDIPLLRKAAVEAAKDSGFICRGCTGPMTYRITYDFRLVAFVEQIESGRAVITSTSATLPIAVPVTVLIDP
jgi:TonB family protein